MVTVVALMGVILTIEFALKEPSKLNEPNDKNDKKKGIGGRFIFVSSFVNIIDKPCTKSQPCKNYHKQSTKPK